MDKADKILGEALQKIGRICAEDCHAFCCRKGFLALTKEQEAMMRSRLDANEQESLVRTSQGVSLNLGKTNCPFLSENKCTIHEDPRRPSACAKFPVFREGNTIMLSGRCLAVQTGFFYPYISLLKSSGYRVLTGDRIYESDFYNIPLNGSTHANEPENR